MLFPRTTLLAALVAAVAAKEIAKDAARAARLYDSGVTHQQIMSNKEVSLCEAMNSGSLTYQN